jgi:hypothetical protein
VKTTRARSFALAAAAAILPAAGAAAAPVYYAVTVTSSVNGTFSDCFEFRGYQMTVLGLDAQAPFYATPAPLTAASPKGFYNAVPTPRLYTDKNNLFSFSGIRTGTATSGGLTATGSDLNRVKYKVTGTVVPTLAACTHSAAAASRFNHWTGRYE